MRQTFFGRNQSPADNPAEQGGHPRVQCAEVGQSHHHDRGTEPGEADRLDAEAH